MELLGLLPAALEGPATLAVALVVTTRVLRNLVAGVHAFLAAFKPQLANDAAAQWAAGLIGVLGPLDSALLKLYTVLAVLAGARVLVKYKSIALEFILRQRLTSSSGAAGLRRGGARGSSSSGGGGGGAGGVGGGSGGSFSLRRSGGSAQADRGAAGAGATGAAAGLALSVDDGDDDLDEAAVVCREGSMLSVSMRPRSSAAAREPAAALVALDGGTSSTSSGGGRKQQQLQQQLVAADAGGGDGMVARLLLPLDTILSWAISVSAVLFVLQTLGINIAPLLAVGGASSLLIGLATQALLTNAVMGLSIFVSRPFLPGDSITVQVPGGILVSGMVEHVTPMRTMLRTDDDVLVTLPNKSIADMIIFNRSRREARNRLVSRSWETPYLKFKVKLPQKELQHLQELQTDLRAVLRRPGVAQDGISVALSRFTDAGAEVLLQSALLVPAGSAVQQQLLLDLAMAVRRHGGTLVSIL